MRPRQAPYATDTREDAMTVDVILRNFDGDARAALSAALEDLAFLRREIEFARLAMSYGFTRGWRPALERPHASGTDKEIDK